MAEKPWEKYAPAKKPWERYAAPQQPTVPGTAASPAVLAELSALSQPGSGQPIPQASADLARAWAEFDRGNPGKAEQYGLDRTQPPPAFGSRIETPTPEMVGFQDPFGAPAAPPGEMVQHPDLSSGQAWRDALSNGMTFGFGDEIQAAVRAPFSDKTYGQIRDELQDRKALGAETYPGISTAGNLGGGVMLPGFGVGKAVAAAPGLLAKTAVGAGYGAGFGALSGAGNAEEGDRLAGAAKGGLLGAALGGGLTALTSGGKAIFDSLMRNRAIKSAGANAPTTAEARKLFGDQFKDLAASGEKIPQADFPAGTIMDDIQGSSYDKLKLGGKSSTPGGQGLVDDVMDIATDPRFEDGVGFDVLQELRQRAAELASDTKDFKPTRDSAVGAAALDAIDNAIDQLGKSGQYKLSREGWARMLKSAKFDKILDNADNYLSGTTSGITNQLKSLLKSPTQSRGFTDAEKKAIQAIIQGSPVDKALRLAGSGLGRLGGTGGAMAAGGPVGAVAAYGATNAAKSIADALTRGKTEALRKALVNGGLKNVPEINGDILARIVAALTRGGVSSQAQGSP